MKYGFVNKGHLLKCANCGTVVGKNDKIICEFCHHCGNPITIDALQQRGEEYTKQRIKLILEIKKEIDAGNNLNDVFNDYLKSIDNE